MSTKREQGSLSSTGFFQDRINDKKRLPSKTPGILNFDNNGLLAYSVLIIDHFLSQATRADEHLAKLILSKLDLFHVRASFPHPQSLKNYLTWTEYFQSLCLSSSTPEALITLTGSIAFCLKQIIMEELLLHPHQYQTIHSHISLSLHSLQSSPTALNPYISQAFYNLSGYGFKRYETTDNKILAKKIGTHIINSDSALYIHWKNGECLVSAGVYHSEWFKSITAKHVQQLKCKLETWHDPHIALIQENIDLPKLENLKEKYLQIKQQFDQKQLTLDELEELYLNNINTLSQSSVEAYPDIFFGTQQFFDNILDAKISTVKPHAQLISQTERLACELKNALIRSIALEIIPDTRDVLHKNQIITS